MNYTPEQIEQLKQAFEYGFMIVAISGVMGIFVAMIFSLFNLLEFKK